MAFAGREFAQRRLHAALRDLKRFVPNRAILVGAPRAALAKQGRPFFFLGCKNGQREPQAIAPPMVIIGGHSSLLDRCKMAEAPPAALAKLAVLATAAVDPRLPRSEEHTSELQSLMRISYAVF